MPVVQSKPSASPVKKNEPPKNSAKSNSKKSIASTASGSPKDKKSQSSPEAPTTPKAEEAPKVGEAQKTEKPKAPGRKKKDKPELPEREVLYPEIEVQIFLGDKGAPFTDEMAKELLGWREESENIKFPNQGTGPSDYLFRDTRGKKIQCSNNVANRPLDLANVAALQQEILQLKWRMNCENRIIGKTGLVLNGQHTFIALIFACQTWEDKRGQYAPWWKTRPTIDTLIAFGAEETDDVVNTMDTCRPRSLQEVIYRSEYFRDMPHAKRKTASKRLADAVKMLWHRTGASLDAFHPKRTHSESLYFIERHPKVLACVKHVVEEDDSEGKIGKFLSVGYAAALLYLMGSSMTERETDAKDGYCQVDTPSEAQLNWERWDEAQEFFVFLASGDKRLAPIREALGELLERGAGTVAERMALLVHAWNAWIADGEVTLADLQLEYATSEDGERVLAECPSVGGVDLGNPKA